ncbi:MAG: xanthine dehydrogenase family protein molybdopterin-binding subunit, partial [Acidobacteria bacterium]|nr:xanthine dehydrogenase family protein molybdopterin-binding subunit [Acidobacteriota bacterium]
MSRIDISTRRGFLEGAFGAGALVLATRILPEPAQAAALADKAVWSPSVYLGLEADGTVILVVHRSEMGTGIRSVLPSVLADELEADLAKVRIEQALGDKKYGSQNTDGSCSIRDFYDAFRQAGATARLMLERAAAAQWHVPAAECKARLHAVVHTPSGRSLAYSSLVQAASALPVPGKDEIRLKSPSEFRYIGKELPIWDQQAIVAGSASFGQDARVPGMVYASIERSPVFGGTVKSFNDAETLKVKGVRQTVQLDHFKPPHLFQALGGVAVIADNTWSAMQGRKRLQVQWEPGPNAAFDSAEFKASLQQTVRKPQKVVRNIGNVDQALASAAKTHEADYYCPLLAHASMEPPAAVAEFHAGKDGGQGKDGKVTVWAPVQDPQSVQDSVGAALGIPPANVTCHVTLLGGGFGRKSKPDFAVEAALLSRKTGKPVKVVWSREEDLRFDYYHTTGACYLKGALDAKGNLAALLHRSAFPTIGSTFEAGAESAMDIELGMNLIDPPLDIPHFRAENGPARNHVRIGWLRSVANVYHGFALSSFMDEMAHLAGRDPVEFLLSTLGPGRKLDFADLGGKYWNYNRTLADFPYDTARIRRVVELAAEKSGWANKKPSKGRALGIAALHTFLTSVAAVVEVEVDASGNVTIPRVDYAVDCGAVINPDRVRAQFEGAAVFGTSIAMLGEITA